MTDETLKKVSDQLSDDLIHFDTVHFEYDRNNRKTKHYKTLNGVVVWEDNTLKTSRRNQ